MNTLVIPIYKNAENIGPLFEALQGLAERLPKPLEVVFVIDGSPDMSFVEIRRRLPAAQFTAKLIQLSRNYGSFAAIRAGIESASGEAIAVMAADLQEPIELVDEFFKLLTAGECDVVIGTRSGRTDPFFSRLSSNLFWGVYRRLVIQDVPPGGVDVFGCNRQFRAALSGLTENHSSLIGLLFWLGFRRKEVPYERQPRQLGKSAWTFSKKLRYLNDSFISITDFPIRCLMVLGTLGSLIFSLISIVVFTLRIAGVITVPGYAATALMISLFAGINMLGLGIIGNYVWRVYENTKGRPLFVTRAVEEFERAK